MKKIIKRFDQKITCNGENGKVLEAYYDHRGNPYREGITLYFNNYSNNTNTCLFLKDTEAIELQKFINKLYPT